MTNVSIAPYEQLNALVASVQHGRPRTLSLVESTLEAVRAFVPIEVANGIDIVLSAPYMLDYSDEGQEVCR